jgi:NADPH-dependent 2,4-dienoyl-CoA reductase/sulfur reductase-like enzyme/peroxiredoxin family protein/rhodanese-related sulfurtransferase/TusA-related sulfurtransferase
MEKKIIIVGGVAGGASAAARLRRLDEHAEIIIMERGSDISYANCGLPYYIGGIIPKRSHLLVQTPEGMGGRFGIDVRVRNEVLTIDANNKQLEVMDHANHRNYTETYDILLLSPGATPVRPSFPGSDGPNVFTLRNIPDTDAIKEFIEHKKPKHAIVVGGGFIGLEMAENLTERGVKTLLVEMAEQVMTNVDREMAALIHQHLREKGVELQLKSRLVKLDTIDEKTTEAVFDDGHCISTELVIMAVGVRPDTRLAKEAGIQLGETGAIRVDERFQTSDPHIYAVGDAVEVSERLAGKRVWLPLAGPANRQGRLVADAIAGRQVEYKGVIGTSIAKIFDLAVASTGWNERMLSSWGISYQTSITHSNSHASYYPGALPLTIKLIFANDGRVLGAQAIGYAGVDKRIDLIAATIRFGGSVDDLADLELAYAPPFSSAKDPVNIAGYVGGNILRGDVSVLAPIDLAKLDPAKTVVLDVRDAVERETGFIPGSINIPLPELRQRLSEVPKEKEVITYCAVGLRAYIAARILKQNGYQVRNLSGGYRSYQPLYADINSSAPTHGGHQKGGEPAMNGENVVKLDACGLQCPGPIVQVFKKMETLNVGDTLEVIASDPGFLNDIDAWCQRTGNILIRKGKEGQTFVAVIKKGQVQSGKISETVTGQDKTIVVFSGDLDKAIAAFIIANGAAAMGRRVTLFFTFWGLNILRRRERISASKQLIDRMFGWMMPRGSKRLGLSKMNMVGFGPKIIRMVMKNKNIDSLEALINQARLAGVRLVACQMSMDVMGIKKEELIEGTEIGGVASYLAAAEQGNVNLFI